MGRGDDETTAFPREANVPGQAESRSAYAGFAARQEECPWWEEYLQLRAEKWTWRQAAYIAWAASPATNRWPATQEALAHTVLGLRSDRTIRTWKKKRPEIERRIAELQVAPLLRHRRDVIEALVSVATTPDPKAHPDRKLYLEMTGDYHPRAPAQTPTGDGKDSDLAQMSDDELRAILSD